jgi:hypothetical protein
VAAEAEEEASVAEEVDSEEIQWIKPKNLVELSPEEHPQKSLSMMTNK